jgi:hypothetical protein
MNNIKSTTEINLPFGSMRFTHGKLQGKWQTMYQLVFEGSSHFDLDQHQPTCWKHQANRKDVRNLMISEGGATLEEAVEYIRILVSKQWAFRKGKHSMKISKAEANG